MGAVGSAQTGAVGSLKTDPEAGCSLSPTPWLDSGCPSASDTWLPPLVGSLMLSLPVSSDPFSGRG